MIYVSSELLATTRAVHGQHGAMAAFYTTRLLQMELRITKWILASGTISCISNNLSFVDDYKN